MQTAGLGRLSAVSMREKIARRMGNQLDGRESDLEEESNGDPEEWAAIRDALRAARIAAKIEEKELAALGVTSQSNVYRIENVAEYPTQRPTLATIKKWLRVTTGESLGQFFSRLTPQPPIEKSGSTDTNLMSHKEMTYPVQPASDTVRDQQPRPINVVAAEGVPYGPFGARSGLEITGITETEARILEHIGTLLVRASHLVLAPSPDGQVAGEEPRRRKTDR